jgi:hypothetical protein
MSSYALTQHSITLLPPEASATVFYLIENKFAEKYLYLLHILKLVFMPAF